MAEGAEEIGTQGMEVDKNGKVRVETKQAGSAEHVPLKLKSRLVAPGSQERREERSFARYRQGRCSAETWRARTSLSSHEQDCQDSAEATACWHAYGTRDAELRFPKKFRRTLIGGSVTENRVLQSSALFDHRRGARAATCT